ncbi:MAG: T9SS type A sorting domain-containing protein, partial [Ignavibacteriales bacterium]|nr:T9SS type A sorting domain-containing protein [Ignavibacteriales bacterium]
DRGVMEVFNIGLAEITVASVNVDRRWNMLSVPVTVNDYTKSTLFPMAVSPAFAFQGTYMQKDTLTNSVGYWLKFDSAQTVSMAGQMRNTDSISVQPGWNLIGSISQPVPISTIASDPPGLVTSQFFGYDGSYVTADSILPGKAYWVKVSDGGMLILSFSGGASAMSKIKIVLTTELPPPSPDGNVSGEKEIPTSYALEQNYPNPFNPTTVISFQLPVSSYVTLKVYNVLGQEVAVVVDEIQDAGFRSVKWDASGVASGLNFYRLEATSVDDPSKIFRQVRRMSLLK